jgi:hypothetical protein
MNTEDFLFTLLHEIASTAAQGAAYHSWSDDFARKEVQEVWEDLSAPLRRARNRRVTVAEMSALSVPTLRRLGFKAWDDGLTVVPLWVFHYLADGETLTCINGESVVKGKATIDLDVRGGCLAYGFATPIGFG